MPSSCGGPVPTRAGLSHGVTVLDVGDQIRYLPPSLLVHRSFVSLDRPHSAAIGF